MSDGFDFGSITTDLTLPPQLLDQFEQPWTPSFSFSDLVGGPSGIPSYLTPPSSISGTFKDILSSLTGGAQAFYQSQAQIERAKADAAVAKAQGQNAVQVARAGLPSPQLLLFGGLGLAGLLILTRKK